MRALSIAVVGLVVFATPALALSAGDSMQAWGAASSPEKDALLRTLNGTNEGEASRDRLRSCLDKTAMTTGHASLPISEVAKACSEQAARENI